MISHRKFNFFCFSLCALVLTGCDAGDGSQKSDGNGSSAPASSDILVGDEAVGNLYFTRHEKRTELYHEGKMTDCERFFFDGDGRIEKSVSSTIYSYDSSPNNKKKISFKCSDEDTNQTVNTYTYDASGRVFTTYAQSTHHNTPKCKQFTLDKYGRLISEKTFSSSGENYVCSTRDGELIQTYSVVYSGMNYPSELVFTSPDGKKIPPTKIYWSPDYLKSTRYGMETIYDDDDKEIGKVKTSTTTVFKSKLKPDYEIYKSAGVDKKLDTDDDVWILYTVYEYENGKNKKGITYNSPGKDGNWLTLEDNRISNISFF